MSQPRVWYWSQGLEGSGAENGKGAEHAAWEARAWTLPPLWEVALHWGGEWGSKGGPWSPMGKLLEVRRLGQEGPREKTRSETGGGAGEGGALGSGPLTGWGPLRGADPRKMLSFVKA